jgi:hypothetical protein
LWLFSQDYGRFLEKQHHTTQSLQRELEETKEQLAAALEAKGDAARHSPAVAAPPVSLVAPEIQTVPSRGEETPLAAVTAAATVLSTTAGSDSKEVTATAMTAATSCGFLDDCIGGRGGTNGWHPPITNVVSGSHRHHVYHCTTYIGRIGN